MAVLLAKPELGAGGLGFGSGTLAEASLSGGTPRPMLENVNDADWSPDGSELEVRRFSDGKSRIEYPIGKVLYETTAGLGQPRVSRDGSLVAFLEFAATGLRWTLKVMDRKGSVQTVVTNPSGEISSNVCWSPGGRELWWFKVPGNIGLVQASELCAVTMAGKERVVASLPGEFILHDLSPDGRLLVEHVKNSYSMLGSIPGQVGERNLDWLDQSVPADLSPDGKLLLFQDRGDAAGSMSGSYIRDLNGSPAVHLGDGAGGRFSPDGKWVLLARKVANPLHAGLVLIPVGAGQERILPPGGPEPLGTVAFHPDGTRIFFDGAEPGRPPRVYEQSIDGAGLPKAVTPDRTLLRLVSPDGKLLLIRYEDAKDLLLYPTDPASGLAPRTVELNSVLEEPQHWSADGRSLLILCRQDKRPLQVDRLDLATGHRTPWKTLPTPGDLGSGGLIGFVVSRNEDSWVAGYVRNFSELMVVDGLK